MPRLRRAALLAVALLLTPVLPALHGFGLLLALNEGTPVAGTGGSGRDALWLGHDWAAGRYSPTGFATLVARVRTARIRDLFVHTGPLASDGALDPALAPGARTFVAAVHAALPGVRVQSWLGARTDAGGLDPDDPATRARVLAAAGQALADGFDGVHYDLEPVASGDPGYLALLADTHRLTAARHAVLSVAADQLEPVPGLRFPEQWLAGRPHFWSTGFLAEVGARVDEIAVMSYDSAVPTAAAYSGYVRLQTRLAAAAVPATVDLVMGLPAYHTGELGHTGGETVAAAVRGVRLAGLGERVGVALYADFSATPADWRAYVTGWAGP